MVMALHVHLPVPLQPLRQRQPAASALCLAPRLQRRRPALRPAGQPSVRSRLVAARLRHGRRLPLQQQAVALAVHSPPRRLQQTRRPPQLQALQQPPQPRAPQHQQVALCLEPATAALLRCEHSGTMPTSGSLLLPRLRLQKGQGHQCRPQPQPGPWQAPPPLRHCESSSRRQRRQAGCAPPMLQSRPPPLLEAQPPAPAFQPQAPQPGGCPGERRYSLCALVLATSRLQ